MDAVVEEIGRLEALWLPAENAKQSQELRNLLGEAPYADLDLFDREQLTHVIGICRESQSLSEAGRVLFQASRQRKETANDADRLRKYLTATVSNGPPSDRINLIK
jgi:transcriptional regulatory protein RtcR